MGLFLAPEKIYFELSIKNLWLPNGTFRTFDPESFWVSKNILFGLLNGIILDFWFKFFWALEPNPFDPPNGIISSFQKELFRASIWSYFGLLNGISAFQMEFFWTYKLNPFGPPFGIIFGFWVAPEKIFLGIQTKYFRASEWNNF